MHRGEKIKKILLALADGALATMEILDELWPTGFTRSHYTNRKRAFRNKTFDFAQEQEFYNLLSYLKRHGLIEKKNNGNRTFWKITADGLNKLLKIKEKALDYESQSDGKLKIIVFDVPEEYKKKRRWLREALKILGFKMLQKSVWIGKNKIPEQFLFDLRQKQILQYIHIMEVGKTGTVRELA